GTAAARRRWDAAVPETDSSKGPAQRRPGRRHRFIPLLRRQPDRPPERRQERSVMTRNGVNRRLDRSVAPVLLAALLAACGGGDEAADEPAREGSAETMAAAETMTVADAGFQTPESVLHDPAADVYIVSNISGNPPEKDNDGFLSRVSPEGQVIALKWVEG